MLILSQLSSCRISSLDAMVFGYLELILQYTLPGDNVLQQKLNSCHNLVTFCDQIRSLAFPNMKRTMQQRSL